MSAALIDVRLPDGSTKQLPSGASALDLAAVIGPRLAKAAVAAVVNDHETDLLAPLHSGDRVAIITVDTDAGRHVLRHSTAHVLAQAVLQLFPGAKFTVVTTTSIFRVIAPSPKTTWR
jgi:threonyl-tRNA synthetase